MARIVVFDNRKSHDAVLVRELRLAQNLVEKPCHVLRRIAKRAAPPCTQHDGVVAVKQSDAEHGANLLLRGRDRPINEKSIGREVWTVDGGHGYNRALKRRLDETVAVTRAFAEEHDTPRIDAAGVPIHRVASIAERQAKNASMVVIKLIERDAEIALAEK